MIATWNPIASAVSLNFQKVFQDDNYYIISYHPKEYLNSEEMIVTLLQIERIQNPLQYQQFRARKTSKLAGNSAKGVSRQLFHGTIPENAESICLYGFNRTYAGKNGEC